MFSRKERDKVEDKNGRIIDPQESTAFEFVLDPNHSPKHMELLEGDSLADRLMYRFAYRRRTTASAAETAVVNHSVKVSGTKRK